MTTPFPHDPPPPPGGAYPTSPPWASTTPADPGPAPPGPDAADPGAWAGHGRLLVPYPEEMFNATRPRPPSWVPVVILTMIFPLFGAVSAARRAGKARRGLNDRHPYWIAFGATLTAGVVVGVVTISLTAPMLLIN